MSAEFPHAEHWHSSQLRDRHLGAYVERRIAEDAAFPPPRKRKSNALRT